MSPPRNANLRRFALVWAASLLWKIAAVVVIAVLVLRWAGGGGL